MAASVPYVLPDSGQARYGAGIDRPGDAASVPGPAAPGGDMDETSDSPRAATVNVGPDAGEVSVKAALSGDAASVDAPQEARLTAACPTKTPERHLLGEFPMTCYRCHVEADS